MQIERVELLQDNGMSTSWSRTGDPVSFRLHYHAKVPIERPVFRIVVLRVDGIEISGPNTREGGCVPERVEGSGFVDLVVDRLPLLPGTYDMNVSVHDYSILHEYDVRHRAFRFDVEQGEPRESLGLVTLGGRWHFRPDAEPS